MISHVIYPDENYLVQVVAASVTADEIIDYDRTLRADPDFRPDLDRIYDFRELTNFQLSTMEILKSVRRLEEWNMKRSIRIAFVTESMLTRGTIKLITSHYTHYNIRAFPLTASAKAWILEGNPRTEDTTESSATFKRMTLRGQISLDDIMRKQIEWFGSPHYDPTTPILWDLRQTSTEGTINTVKERAPFVLSNAKISKRTSRSAILVDNYMIEMMAKEVSKNTGWRDEDYRICRKESDAIDWVSYDPKTLPENAV